MSRPLLDHPQLAARSTPAHRQLRERLDDYFHPGRLEGWLGGAGHLKKGQWEEFGRLGLLGLSLPPDLGGSGLGLLGALIRTAAASRVTDLGVSLGLNCQSEITAHWLATAHQVAVRDRYLSEMIAGSLVGCACDTDPGSQQVSVAVREGAEIVIDARKLYVINGVNADLCFVTVRLEGQLATVLVEADRPGVRRTEVFDKLGTRAVDSAALEFSSVRVPAENLSTKSGMRHLVAWNKVMSVARFLMCVDAALLHADLLTRMLVYASERIVDGCPLASRPIHQHVLAGAAIDQELMQAGLIDVFLMLEDGRSAVSEIAALKWFCVDRTARFASLCAEMEGGAGYMWTSPFLRAQAQVLGLKMAGGSLMTMQSIANQTLAYREELEAMS